VLCLGSGLVPKALAAWGVAASGLLGLWAFALIPVPELRGGLGVVLAGGPILLFELTFGIWLVLAKAVGTAET
jgi:hypothetical protein